MGENWHLTSYKTKLFFANSTHPITVHPHLQNSSYANEGKGWRRCFSTDGNLLNKKKKTLTVVVMSAGLGVALGIEQDVECGMILAIDE